MFMNSARLLELGIEKHRSITNVIGTLLVAWMLSGIAAQLFGFLLPKTKSAVSAPKSFDNGRPTLSSFGGTRDTSFYMPICERNIFDSQRRVPCLDEVPTEEDIDPDAAPIKSDLNATLLGTMVFTNPDISFATVAGSGGGDSKNYRIGDTIQGEAKIYDIQRNKVYFTRKGRREYLQVDRLPVIYSGADSVVPSTESSEGIRTVGDKILITRAKVDATLGNLNNIIQDSRMSPNVGADGKVDGFKVFAIRKGSIFEQLGLKNGDVIHKINGTAIDSLEKALPMMQLLKSESSVGIDISRGGSKKALSIEIQ